MELTDEITNLKGIGEKTATLFNRVGVSSLWDLFNYLPNDYIQYPVIKKTNETVAGGKYALELTIKSEPTVLHVRGLNILNVTAADDTGTIMLTWYNVPYLKKVLHPGMKKVFYGRADVRKNALCLTQPKMFDEEEYLKLRDSLQPVYPLTKGLTTNTVNKAVARAFKECSFPEDFLGKDERKELGVMELYPALKTMHLPQSREDVIKARERLVFNEFYFFIRNVRYLKNSTDKAKNEFPVIETAEAKRYIEHLPYELTGAQKRAYEDIINDLGSEYVMNRLVQGDVGSGKTVVAMLAMINVIKNGYQAALMAPTEVLAAQHMKNLSAAAKELDINCILLTGALTEKEKRLAREKIASGEAELIIGTHALITDLVEFKNLALAITDEQHRFGVNQRRALSEKCGGKMPHVLVMSATPIPRTLAIIIYGDLDISVMDEVPAKRLPIKNCVVGKAYRPKAYSFIKKEVRAGHQAYVICPLVEESESSDLENVTDYSKDLQDKLGRDIRVQMLHGRMKPKEKDKIMEDFAEGNIDVLVSTTVVEVGVDVPNATVMLIENAEMFGLSQLHQLRGRIGRGDLQSYCIFMDNSEKKEKNERLQIMNGTNDGFKIASEDLRLRGPGDIFGLRQSGDMVFKIGDIFTDAAILQKASDYADKHPYEGEEGTLSAVESLYGRIL